MSGLPNEVDLSLNSVLFLSAVVHPSPATPLRLSSSRNLLQLMLATVGVYEDGGYRAFLFAFNHYLFFCTPFIGFGIPFDEI